MAQLVNQRLLFETDLGYEEGDLLLREVHGVEALSTLYDFDLTMQCTIDGGLDDEAIDELLRAKVSIGFGENGLRKVSGCISQVQLLEMTEDGQRSMYRMELVPRLWRTTLTHRSRCFVETSIPDIIKAVLEDHGFAEDTDFRFELAPGDYFDNADHHVVQYQETDFAFLSRWMERLGIFYYFEQADDGDVLVICDANNQLAEAPENSEVEHSYNEDLNEAGKIAGLRKLTRARPEKLHVRDYNWRLAEDKRDEIASSRAVGATTAFTYGDSPVDETGGTGFVAYYGDHFPDDDAGAVRAERRAQEWMTNKHVCSAWSVNSDYWPGQRITLSRGPTGDFDIEYVLTTVVHEASYSTGGGAYSNSFEMIAFEQQYRPPRRARWPRIDGVMHAKIDAADVSSTAPIDNRGRYRVILPYDLYGKIGESPSCWIRKAEPYAGPIHGMHFTLHIGTEVLIAHIGGDPDRPVIVGAVSNDAKQSPITDREPTRSAIRTRSGILIAFEDDA